MSEPVQELFALPSVTSDSRPWFDGRSVKVCSGCGVMQRVLGHGVNYTSVYDDYKMFNNSNGADQMNFSGVPEGRTAKILKFLSPKLPPHIGSILDIGSGNGAGVRALAAYSPQSAVHGFEPNSDLSAVNFPENVTILTDRPTARKFDLVTLFHVFEHVEDLHEMLDYVKSVLSDNGHLIIQVPYTVMGPFDLVIADHIWHFNGVALAEILNNCGFETIYNGNDVIKKEVTILAKISNRLFKIDYDVPIDVIDKIKQMTSNWVLSYKKFLDSVDESVAIYGSGPAAAWAGSILGDRVTMYIDDDICRVGANFNERPIKSTDWLDAGIGIVAPFPDWQLEEIKKKNPKLRFL